MGKLYGSEYWTYLLPKRVGATKAQELTEALLPISTRTAHQIGLIDDAFEEDAACFRHQISQLAQELASSYRYEHLLEEKRHTRKTDEAGKPLQAYREEELQHMWRNFFGADQSYHLARQRFVYKGLIPSATFPDHPCLVTFTPGITPVSLESSVANVPNDERSDVVGARL